jgi:hypothetical protein
VAQEVSLLLVPVPEWLELELGIYQEFLLMVFFCLRSFVGGFAVDRGIIR